MKLVPKYQGGKSLVKAISKVIGKQGKIRLQLPEHTVAKPREFVLEPQGNNQYYAHMRTWDGDHIPAQLSPEQRKALFEATYNELSQEAIILAPKSSPEYLATRGTVAGIRRLERDPRFIRWGQPQPLMYTDKDGTTKEMLVTGFRKHPKITLANAVNTPDSEWDNAYNTALGAGDMEEVQRLRDLHFRAKAPDTKIVDEKGMPLHTYHGSPNNFTVFDPNRSNGGNYGEGFYFSPRVDVAQRYATKDGNIMDTYLNLKTEDIFPNDRYGEIKYNDGAILADQVGRKNLKYAKEFRVNRPNQIKLAGPVTYDDDGNVIPLSKRDDFTKNDTRWGIFPWLFGTSLLMQNNEK